MKYTFLTIPEYLKLIKMDDKEYQVYSTPCEICSSTEATLIRDYTRFKNEIKVSLPIVSCNQCGFLFQQTRFEQRFYDRFYDRNYRALLYGQTKPTMSFVQDQIQRSQNIYNYIKKYLKKRGNLLDVGCSAGGTMIPYLQNGWQALGFDPDFGFVDFAQKELKLPVKLSSGENLDLQGRKFDLILILGSLEHVVNPNKILSTCRAACNENGLLLLSGKGQTVGDKVRLPFNHNHVRYLSLNSMALFMLKHGWEPLFATSENIDGGRLGKVFCLGKAGKKCSRAEFLNLIKTGKREDAPKLRVYYDQIEAEELNLCKPR